MISAQSWLAVKARYRGTSILSFDLDATLRWLKPHKQQRQLSRRSDNEMDWLEHAPRSGAPVLLDATVYIDTMQGRSPQALDDLISLRACNHSAVCLAELTHIFGRLNPADPRTPAVLNEVEF